MIDSKFGKDQSQIKDVGNLPDYDFKVEIVWKNVVKMAIIHILAIYGLYLGIYNPHSFKEFIYVIIIEYSCGLSILAGAHRLWSHKAYKAKLPLKIYLAFFQTAAMQNNIYEWCRDHRLHHKYSETDADPHNSNRGFFFAHMGWLLCKKHPEVREKGKTLDMSDLLADPVISFQKRHYIPLVILIRGIIFTLLPMYLFNRTLLESICLNMFLYVISLHNTWLVNSAAHMFGYTPYDKNINPTENRAVVYLTLGEGYHNYHHTFPYDYSASEHGWTVNFNVATAFIDFCAKIGLAYDLKKAPIETVKARIERTGGSKNLSRLNIYIDYICGQLFVLWPYVFMIGINHVQI